MNAAENDAGLAEARPELLSHVVIELVEYRPYCDRRQALFWTNFERGAEQAEPLHYSLP